MKIRHLLENEQAVQVLGGILPGMLKMAEAKQIAFFREIWQREQQLPQKGKIPPPGCDLSRKPLAGYQGRTDPGPRRRCVL